MAAKRMDYQTYNDGVCDLYRMQDITEQGKQPVQRPMLLYGSMRYHLRSASFAQAVIAQQNNARIDRVYRMQRRENVSTQDIVKEGDAAYAIIGIDYPDTMPPSMDIQLQRRVEDFDTL